MPKAEDYLYPNQMIVEIDDYDGLQAELDRLRAENAAIEAATIERCAHLCDSFEEPHMARLIRKLAKTANETEGKLGGGGAAGDDPGFSTGSR